MANIVSDVVDGNANTTGEPAGLSANSILDHVGGPFEPTTRVMHDKFMTADPFTAQSSTLSSPEGSVQVLHHDLNAIPTTPPTQDYAGVRDAGAE